MVADSAAVFVAAVSFYGFIYKTFFFKFLAKVDWCCMSSGRCERTYYGRYLCNIVYFVDEMMPK